MGNLAHVKALYLNDEYLDLDTVLSLLWAKVVGETNKLLWDGRCGVVHKPSE